MNEHKSLTYQESSYCLQNFYKKLTKVMLLWSNNIMAGCRCSVWLWGISLVHVVSVFSHARMLLSDLCSLWALCSLSPADNNRVESVLRPVQLSHTPPGVFRARCQSLLALPPTLNRFDPRYLWTAQNLKTCDSSCDVGLTVHRVVCEEVWASTGEIFHLILRLKCDFSFLWGCYGS